MNKNNLQKLLTPSWLVNVIGLAIGVIATGVIIVIANYQGSALQQQIYDVRSRSIVDQQQGIYANISLDQKQTSFIGSLPLLLTWAAIGLGVYFVAMALTKNFGQAASLHEEMRYVNASPAALRKQVFQKLAIRVVALLIWILLIRITLAILIPYAIAAATAASTGFSIQAAVFAIAAVFVLYSTTVVHAIFVRLVMLKPRLFGN